MANRKIIFLHSIQFVTILFLFQSLIWTGAFDSLSGKNRNVDNNSMPVLAVRPDPSIILRTGFSERINEEKAKHIGIREFRMKPVTRSHLAEAVRKELD